MHAAATRRSASIPTVQVGRDTVTNAPRSEYQSSGDRGEASFASVRNRASRRCLQPGASGIDLAKPSSMARTREMGAESGQGHPRPQGSSTPPRRAAATTPSPLASGPNHRTLSLDQRGPTPSHRTLARQPAGESARRRSGTKATLPHASIDQLLHDRVGPRRHADTVHRTGRTHERGASVQAESVLTSSHHRSLRSRLVNFLREARQALAGRAASRASDRL